MVAPAAAGLFFCKMGCCVFLDGFVDLDAADAAFHHQLSQEGMVHEGAFQYL